MLMQQQLFSLLPAFQVSLSHIRQTSQVKHVFSVYEVHSKLLTDLSSTPTYILRQPSHGA